MADGNVRVLVHAGAREDIAAAAPALAEVMGGYIRRLRRDPLLGRPTNDGRYRRVYLDVEDSPAQVWPPRRRRVGADGEGRRFRVVYRLTRGRRDGTLVVIVLSAGRGHVRPGGRDAYQAAEERWQEMILARAEAAGGYVACP